MITKKTTSLDKQIKLLKRRGMLFNNFTTDEIEKNIYKFVL